MNRGLFNEVKLERDSGGVPVPAMVMPLRYAFEGMLIAQATRNPFEIERIRIQRKIDRFREKAGEAKPEEVEDFEKAKEGLRRLLASGARDREEARELISRISRMVSKATPLEVSSMKIWPEGDDARPTYTWFLNDRIELLVREAETFRNDYRNKNPKHVFLALEKPIPFYESFEFLHDEKDESNNNTEIPGQIETMKFCGWLLFGVSLGCCGITAWVIGRQNRRVS